MPRSHIAWELFISGLSFCLGVLFHSRLADQCKKRQSNLKWHATNRRETDFLKLKVQ